MAEFVSVLIAQGANNIEVPCRIYNLPLDEAKVEVEKLLGIDARYIEFENGEEFFFHDESWDRPVPFEDWDEETQEFILENWGNEVDVRFMAVFGKKIFTHYYGGCGEAYSFKLQEVKFDSVFVCWDLD